ncbi:MAG: M6 family metalloprotease domain-containing protein [Candidatus Zixiibacteriota bacterium]
MKAMKTSLFVTILVVLLTSVVALAVPPSEEVIQQLKEDGRYEQYLETMADARSRGVDAPTINKEGFARASFASATSLKTLVILIDFPDKLYTSGLTAATQTDFQNLLFSEGVITTGSMREFYIENSMGEFLMEGDVAGWYTASQNASYYTNYCDGSHGMGSLPNNAQGLVQEAIALANADVDFSEYDNDGDGWVDGIFVVHAGTGYEETGNDCEIHSHKWSIPAVQYDGVWISTYSIEPEESPTSGSIIPIGVFCHEFGHVLGLPDLYDTDYSSSGVGRWAVMSGGSYNNGSKTPATFCAWSKYQLGWSEPYLVDSNVVDVEIVASASSNTSYRVWKNGLVTSQYFLIENKYKTGYDSYLPGEGLLIWHIDNSVGGNYNEWHPLVFLEQADGKFDLQYDNNNGDNGDPFPGSSHAYNFDDETTPNSRDYSGNTTQVAVWNISNADSVMTANIDIVWSRPNISLSGYEFTDTAYGDSDGIFEEGETIQLVLEFDNKWKEAFAAQIDVTIDDPLITMTQSTSYLGDIPAGASADNISAPIEFEIQSGHIARIDSFFVEVTADGGDYSVVIPIQQNIGTTNILIVDDDNNDTLEVFYTESFYEKRKPFDEWDLFSSGSPDGLDLRQYGTVIWFTGDYQDNPLMTADITALKSYLDVGGNLFLTGQGIAKQLSTLDADFLNNYLKAGYTSNTYMPIILPDASGPVLGGLDSLVIQSYGGAGNQTKPDRLTAINGGSAEAAYMASTDLAAVSYSGDYKSILFGFGFEAIGQDEFRFARRDSVLYRVLDFFGEGGPVYTVGDANGDGDVNIGDAAFLVYYIFKGGPPPVPVMAGETNGDCSVNLGDVVYLISYIFKFGPPPYNNCE